MYKKYCLITSILLIIPFVTTTMEVEPEEQQQWIHIKTSEGVISVFSQNSSLFKEIDLSAFRGKGTEEDPIFLPTIDSNQLILIHKFILKKTDPEKLKQFLQALDIDDLNNLIETCKLLGAKKLIEFMKLVYIKTSDFDTINAMFTVPKSSLLFTQSEFLKVAAKGKFKEQGTADNPIILPRIDSKELKLIHTFIVRQKDPEKLKQFLKALGINDLSQLIAAANFLLIQIPFESVVPYLVKHLQDHEKLDTWIKDWWSKTFYEYEELSDHIKKHITRRIKLTLRYLHQKPISFDVLGTHNAWVWSVAFSPDGTILASGSDQLWLTSGIPCTVPKNKTIKLWNLKTGKVRIFGYTGNFRTVAFSPNGRIFASGSSKGAIIFWDVKTGTEIRTLIGHIGGVFSIIFSPDGTKLISGSHDKTIKLWDVERGTAIDTIIRSDSWITSVAINPDFTTIAFGSTYGEIKLYDVITGEIHTLKGRTLKEYENVKN